MNELVETILVDAEIIESNEKEPLPEGVIQKVKFKIAGRGDFKNGNGRVYPRAILMRESKAGQDLADKGMLMMNGDHPPLTHRGGGAPVAGPHGVAAIIKKLSYNESDDTLAIDELHVLDTSAGRDIKTIIKAGGKLGVSTRGPGSSKKGKYKTSKGESLEGDIIQNDWKLRAIDFVTAPSVTDARVESFTESTEERMEITLENLKKEHPDLFKQIQTEAVTAAQTNLMAEAIKKFEEKEEAIRTEITESLSGDSTENEKKLVLKNQELTVKVESLTKELTKTKDDLKALMEAESTGTKEIRESVQALKARVDKEDAAKWLVTKTAGHPMRDALLERCSDAKDVTEAEAKFNDSIKFLEAIAKKRGTGELGGKGIKNLVEDQNENQTPSQTSNVTNVSRAGFLAGRRPRPAQTSKV